MKNVILNLRYLFCIFIMFFQFVNLGAEEMEMITIQIPGKNISFDMVKISAGKFTMGSNSTVDEDADEDEEPERLVTIDKDYYIGKFEVTQALWKVINGNNPSYFKKDSYPVEQITWYEAITFANRLSILAKLDICYNEYTGECDISKSGFRLPSEAEWEYACRAGTRTTYFQGNDYNLMKAYAVFDETSKGSTLPVGSLKPNNWKIHDMSGNVFEWCQNLEVTPPEIDDSAEILVKPKYRIIRGGGFGSPYYDCRSANRGYANPNGMYDDTGFRIVKTVFDRK